jgi:hypothetical protein
MGPDYQSEAYVGNSYYPAYASPDIEACGATGTCAVGGGIPSLGSKDEHSY